MNNIGNMNGGLGPQNSRAQKNSVGQGKSFNKALENFFKDDGRVVDPSSKFVSQLDPAGLTWSDKLAADNELLKELRLDDLSREVLNIEHRNPPPAA